MKLEDLFYEALNLDSPWYIKGVRFELDELHLEVDFNKGSRFFDDNNGTDSGAYYRVHDTVQKSWRHLNFLQYKCYITARTPRIKRDDGCVRLISPPWSGVLKGFSLLFEALLHKLCKDMPVSKVGSLFDVSDDKIWRMLDIYCFGAKMSEDYSDVTVIGLDETSVARGHDYISLFVDLLHKRTIFIGDGKGSKVVKDFSTDLTYHNSSSSQIKEVSCDMSPAFIKGVNENLENAKITFDKFHILKIINEGVNSVRKEEAKENPILKGAKFSVLKNDNNLTKRQRKKKEELQISELNLKTIQAMHIRENFQAIYQASTEEDFKYLLEKWYLWASNSALAPMVKVSKTIKKHWEGIVRWKKTQINNGILEGLNSVLQAAKRKAKGYKKQHFQTIAYLLTGKLDFSKVNKFCTT